MESSNTDKNLKLLAEKKAQVLKNVEAHFAYLEKALKENANAQLAINNSRQNRVQIELGKYVSVFNKESFIPTVPHSFTNLYQDITQTIGNTPLVRLKNLGEALSLKGEVYLKLEYFNPLNSVKDRIGVSMIDEAFSSGRATKDTVFIEPTSGNTGIGLAFVAAARGLKLILTLPEHLSEERQKMFQLLGAKLVTTPQTGGMKAAIEKANELKELIPNSMILMQFENASNPKIHRETTAEELWSDTNGKIDYLVSGVGTGGTITGCGEVLQSRKSSFQVIAVEPQNSPVLSGGQPGPHVIQGIGAGFVPKVLNTAIYDEIYQAEDQDAIQYMRKVLSLEGIPIGISSGAIIQAAIELAQKDENQGKIIVAVVPSCTERYLSTDALQDEFLTRSDEQDIQKEYAKK